jgi:hypothetical protein
MIFILSAKNGLNTYIYICVCVCVCVCVQLCVYITFSSLICFLLLWYWGFIVTFTEVLVIYHSWIHPFHHSPLSSLPPFLESFKRSYFSIFIHEYIIFSQYLPSYILSLYPLPLTGTNHGRTCLTFLFCFWKKTLFYMR